MAFPSVTAPLFVPVLPFDRRNSGLIFLKWVGGPLPLFSGSVAFPFPQHSCQWALKLLKINQTILPLKAREKITVNVDFPLWSSSTVWMAWTFSPQAEPSASEIREGAGCPCLPAFPLFSLCYTSRTGRAGCAVKLNTSSQVTEL